MPDEPFLLVSLEEEKAKTLAQVLSNDTARKILDLLSKKELATESEISKELNAPISTIHYNLGLLVKSDLVSNRNFTYSKKGKEIVHYTLSNKYVIIAPRKTEFLKEKLKQFLPVLFISTAAGILLKYAWQPVIDTALDPAPRIMATGIAESSKIANDTFSYAASNQEFAMWFLIGSIFTLAIYFIWAEVILKKLKK